MATRPTPSEEEVNALLSVSAFKEKYSKVLIELDALHRGVFDEADAEAVAALCLLAQAALINIQATAEFTARALKRDIDFAKAEAYSRFKSATVDGKKPTDTALTMLVNKDEKVSKVYSEQNKAEKESGELKNILALLKDAHLIFRAMTKRNVNG